MSSKLEALNGHYAKVLLDVGVFDANNDGLLSYSDSEGKPTPCTISKKRLCLATKELLREGKWDYRIPFHPLSEQINQGPSPILNALKNFIAFRLKETIKAVQVEVMKLAIDAKRHKGMPSKTAAYLTGLTEADEKSFDTLLKVLGSITDAPEKRLLNLMLKNGGEGGALRSCIVTFPIFDDAASGDQSTFFGVKMPRKTKDKAQIVTLMETILGNEEERKAYSSTSSDREAPYYHALIQSFFKLAERLNVVIEAVVPRCEELAGLTFNLDWAEELKDFAEFARINGPAIPPLPGNRGKERDEVKAKTAEPASRAGVFEAGEDDLGPIEEDKPHRHLRDEIRDDRKDRDRDYSPRHRHLREEREDDREFRRDSERERGGIQKRSLSDVLGRSSRDDRDRRDDRRDDRGGRGRRW